MSYQEIIEDLKLGLEKTLDSFKLEMMKLRSGRLSPALIEDIKADCFGSFLPLKQLGAISSVGQREILLQLWDKSYVGGVVSAIEQESLGLSMRLDGNNIYLSSPPLTGETRQDLIHLLNKKKEEIFQEIRRQRDRAWKAIQDGFSGGLIMEDDKYKGKDKLDETARDFRDKIEKMVENKEKEIKG